MAVALASMCCYGRRDKVHRGAIRLQAESGDELDLELNADSETKGLLSCSQSFRGESNEKETMVAVDNDDQLLVRLQRLRNEVDNAHLTWYVVPSEDEHQSEEVGESEKRREYISGQVHSSNCTSSITQYFVATRADLSIARHRFTGSAGTALIPSSASLKPLLFVDSRYWIQAGQQVPEGWEVVRVGSQASGREAVVGGWMEWIVREAEEGSKIGIDPKLISLELARSIQSRLDGSSTQLIPVTNNLVDRTRTVPERSLGPLIPYPMALSGEDTPSKLAKIRQALSAHSTSLTSTQSQEWVYVLPTLPAIAWLLNYRCPTDIPFCPVAYAYLVLTPSKCVTFVDERKVTDEELKTRWKEDGVEVRPYGVDEVGKYIRELAGEDLLEIGEERKRRNRVFAPRECSWALEEASKPASVSIVSCPIDTAKAIKNETEQQNFRNAYLRDGRAMVRWMAWLEKTIVKEERKVGEWAAAQTLTRYRRKEEMFAGLAYEDISASGPNGALPHYAPQRGKDVLVDIDSTYVIDSGAQYQDATIDTTRTLYLGKTPSPEVKRAYTRVLQGHMAAATAVFPRGMPADRLNMLARAPLYSDGLDFGHGLGHGIGSYLAVHESPIFPKNGSFVPGHVTSIEPGYYKEGEWGIRIESVYLCKEVGGDGPTSYFLSWERITQVPIQTSLVDYSLLSKPEIRWLNEHNTAVKDVLLPLLQADEDGDARDWLGRVTKPHKIWPWTGRE